MEKENIADALVDQRNGNYILIARNPIYDPADPTRGNVFNPDGKKYKKEIDIAKAVYDRFIVKGMEYKFSENLIKNPKKKQELEEIMALYFVNQGRKGMEK